MFIKRICYPVHVLGPGKRIGIWVAGCEKRCPGCMSPELQTTDGCGNVSVSKVIAQLQQINEPIDGITISGGEPFLQAEELCELVEYLDANMTQDIIIYSGYRIEELHRKNSPHIESILSHIAVLIDGEYRDDLNDGIGLRGSSNQQIHIFRNNPKYDNLSIGKRELQTFRYNESILIVGIQ